MMAGLISPRPKTSDPTHPRRFVIFCVCIIASLVISIRLPWHSRCCCSLFWVAMRCFDVTPASQHRRRLFFPLSQCKWKANATSETPMCFLPSFFFFFFFRDGQIRRSGCVQALPSLGRQGQSQDPTGPCPSRKSRQRTTGKASQVSTQPHHRLDSAGKQHSQW